MCIYHIYSKYYLFCQFRTEFISEEFKIILTLLNSITNQSNDKNSSVIDIDVIKQFNELPQIEAISKVIDQAHRKQKEIFLHSLSPADFRTVKSRKLLEPMK